MSAYKDSSSPDPRSLTGDLQPIYEINRLVHEPARLMILAALESVEEADFKFLSIATGLTKGNLSRQATVLEEAGYILIRKYYKGKVPSTGYRMTEKGRSAFSLYWKQMSSFQQQFQKQTEEQ